MKWLRLAFGAAGADSPCEVDLESFGGNVIDRRLLLALIGASILEGAAFHEAGTAVS